MLEQIDILDEKGEKTGKLGTFDEVHRQGLLHRSAHVWFVNGNGQLLFQKRSKNVFACAGYWDTSAAGHVTNGDSSIETAKKETREELGISLEEKDFEYLFTTISHDVFNEGTFINNEFNDVYLVHSDLPLSAFHPDPDEVEEVRWIELAEFKKWIEGVGELIVPHDEEYKKLLEYLANRAL